MASYESLVFAAVLVWMFQITQGTCSYGELLFWVSYPGYKIIGSNTRLYQDVDVDTCKYYCLVERSFTCRSVEYTRETEECWLSTSPVEVTSQYFYPEPVIDLYAWGCEPKYKTTEFKTPTISRYLLSLCSRTVPYRTTPRYFRRVYTTRPRFRRTFPSTAPFYVSTTPPYIFRPTKLSTNPVTSRVDFGHKTKNVTETLQSSIESRIELSTESSSESVPQTSPKSYRQSSQNSSPELSSEIPERDTTERTTLTSEPVTHIEVTTDTFYTEEETFSISVAPEPGFRPKVLIKFTLEGDYKQVVEPDLEAFLNHLRKEIAIFSGVPVGRIDNVTVSAGYCMMTLNDKCIMYDGSINVASFILPRTNDSEPTDCEAADNVGKKITSGNLKCTTPTGEQLPVQASSWITPSACTREAVSGGSRFFAEPLYLVLIGMAAVAVILVLIAVVSFIILQNRRKKETQRIPRLVPKNYGDVE